jgi:hypothetical protein
MTRPNGTARPSEVASIDIDALASRLNPVVVAVLRTPLLHWLLSPGLMLIDVTGRRSGRRYTIPVGYQLDQLDREAGTLITLVSEAAKKQWWRNYLEARPITGRMRGKELRGHAVVVAAESEEFSRRIEASLRRVPGMARVFGVTGYERQRGLTPGQHAYLSRQIAIVRIQLDRS